MLIGRVSFGCIVNGDGGEEFVCWEMCVGGGGWECCGVDGEVTDEGVMIARCCVGDEGGINVWFWCGGELNMRGEDNMVNV